MPSIVGPTRRIPFRVGSGSGSEPEPSTTIGARQHTAVLVPSPAGTFTGYDVRLGPLAFVAPISNVAEAIGDGLDVVGASLAPGERKPRPVKLVLAVRGQDRSSEPRQEGIDLRRHVREVFDNAKYRLQGFYFTWEADPDLDGWLMIGSGELGETDPGITFGDYQLQLSDVYLVGRPGTHKPGRRAIVTDLRSGLAPRDTRRLLYSTDFASQALPAEPIYLPGDVSGLVRSGNRPVAGTTLGPEREGARHPWRSVTATDSDVFTYVPDATVLPDRTAYLDLDDLGSVRVWDLSDATVYPPVTSGYGGLRDEQPDVFYGWRRVLGDGIVATAPLAMDNGACRLIWLGSDGSHGVAVEYWDAGLGHFRRIGRVLHAANVSEQRVVECTPERCVVEWRAGQYAMRAVLQRGWWGPRLESYADGGGTARLEYAPEGSGSVTAAPQSPAWVRSVYPASGGFALLWAQGSADEVVTTSPSVIVGNGAVFTRSRVLVASLACPGATVPSVPALASLSVVDARPVPVLVGRN